MYAAQHESRCYWALLSTNLTFLSVDPLLTMELSGEGEFLLGRSLVEFVQPEEQAGARTDIENIINSRVLGGGVTITRFSSFERIRQIVNHRGPPPAWTVAETGDQEYMVVELVVNLAADGVALCFLHTYPSLRRLDPHAMEHARRQSSCGGRDVIPDVHALFQRLHQTVAPPSRTGRVLQILAHTPARQLLMSWPSGGHYSAVAEEFAQLASSAKIDDSDPSTGRPPLSCLQRFKSEGHVHWREEGGPHFVESVYTPHGSIIFACHRIHSSTSPIPPNVPQSTEYGYPTPIFQSNEAYVHRLAPTPHDYSAYEAHHPPYQCDDRYGMWHEESSHPSQYYSSWRPQSGPVIPDARSALYDGVPSHCPYPHGSMGEEMTHHRQPHGRSPPGYIEHAGMRSEDPMSATTKRRTSPSGMRDVHSLASRNSGAPPTGVQQCANCRATTSPEWRKGPSGKKDLCNACGLRYSRLKAKSQGVVTQRRKKSTASDTGSMHAGGGPFSTERRNSADFGTTGISPTAAGMPSHLTHTPSPSPPANLVALSYNYHPYHQSHVLDPQYAHVEVSYSLPHPPPYDDVPRQVQQSDAVHGMRGSPMPQYTNVNQYVSGA